MEKNYKQSRLVSSKNSKIAREQFKAKKEELIQNESFIKKLTSIKEKHDVAMVSESRLIKGRINFAKSRMSSLKEMSEMMENLLQTEKTPVKRADRIIASYLNEKREVADLTV